MIFVVRAFKILVYQGYVDDFPSLNQQLSILHFNFKNIVFRTHFLKYAKNEQYYVKLEVREIQTSCYV